MDQFKQYLREHRSELDVETAPTFEIGGASSQRAASPIPLVRWIAAASILVIASALTYWWLTGSEQITNRGIVKTDTNNQRQPPDSNIADAPPIATIPREVKHEKSDSKELEGKNALAKQATVSRRRVKKSMGQPSPLQSLETNYAAVINYQLKRLERTPIYGESADYFHVFKKQWYDLEKDDEKIRQQMSVYGLSDVVVDQFIQLYQNKIALLKQLQSEIEKMNLRARNHPDFQDQSPTYLKM